MAFPTAVNDQITDSIPHSNTKVLADAPAMAIGSLYQATTQALANAAHNATTAQQQASPPANYAFLNRLLTTANLHQSNLRLPLV